MSSPWSIRRVEDDERAEVVAFMAVEFAKHFAANIDDDTEEVYAVISPDGQLEAAFGLTHDVEHFFSRHYIGDVRRSLADAYAHFPHHARIVEFAHLCVRTPRSICRLIPVLAEFLFKQAEYLVCTATRELALFFTRRGLAPDLLGTATAMQLPVQQRTGWGSYYAHQPVVLSGCLQQACALLNVEPQWQEVREVA